MACRMKEDKNVIGYIEIPEGYWEYSHSVEWIFYED